jgi:threonine dehydrogenase-like Zn-dependent dehydrogenase
MAACEKEGNLMKGLKCNPKIGNVVLNKMHLSGKNATLVFKDDWPEPSVRYPNQVKVRTRLGGICGTDLNIIGLRISMFATVISARERPFPMGHELVGEVSETGDGVSGLKAGDRVVYFPVATCEAYGFKACKSCARGNLESCTSLAGAGDGSEREKVFGGRGAFGGHGGGGFCEHVVGFESQFFKVHPDVPDEAAVLAEPFAAGIHAAARHLPSGRDKVVVVGAGTVGLMVIAALRALGCKCRILAVARYPFQAESAMRLGSDETVVERSKDVLYEKIADMTGGTLFKPVAGKRGVFGGSGPDVIFDCVGTEDSIEDSLHLVRSNGKIVMVGESFSRTKKVDWALQCYKEVEVAGACMYGMEPYKGGKRHAFDLALQFLKQSADHDPERFPGLLTHTFRIEEYRKALESARRKGANRAVKVAFDFR